MLCDASALAPHCACGSASWRFTHVTQTQSVEGGSQSRHGGSLGGCQLQLLLAGPPPSVLAASCRLCSCCWHCGKKGRRWVGCNAGRHAQTPAPQTINRHMQGHIPRLRPPPGRSGQGGGRSTGAPGAGGRGRWGRQPDVPSPGLHASAQAAQGEREHVSKNQSQMNKHDTLLTVYTSESRCTAAMHPSTLHNTARRCRHSGCHSEGVHDAAVAHQFPCSRATASLAAAAAAASLAASSAAAAAAAATPHQRQLSCGCRVKQPHRGGQVWLHHLSGEVARGYRRFQRQLGSCRLLGACQAHLHTNSAFPQVEQVWRRRHTSFPQGREPSGCCF